MKKTGGALPLVVLLLLITTNLAAQKIYMKVELAKTGVVRDQNMPARFQDRIELAGYTFETANTGSGRTRSPLTITKNYGQSTIQLFKAYATKDLVKSVTIEIYKVNNTGAEVLDLAITFTNCRVSLFRQNFDNTPAPGSAKGPLDEFRFTYQKMSISYTSSGVNWED